MSQEGDEDEEMSESDDDNGEGILLDENEMAEIKKAKAQDKLMQKQAKLIKRMAAT